MGIGLDALIKLAWGWRVHWQGMDGLVTSSYAAKLIPTLPTRESDLLSQQMFKPILPTGSSLELRLNC